MASTDQILKIGKEWIKDDMHRIYINDLAGLYGLETVRHKTGNIKSAKLNGEKISNTKATKIEIELNSAKLWYDVITASFNSNGLSDEQYTVIMAQIPKE